MKIRRTPKRTALLLPFIWRMLAIKHLQSNMYHGLLCCSQTVQKIGNIEFPQHSGKEEWMGPLYKWIGFYTDEVKDFLDRLADVEDEQGNHNK